MKELTKAEEEVMQLLWKLEKAFVKEIIAEMPEPKPAYNTVSTIVRILEQKGMVDHEGKGRSYQYFPLVSKEAYSKFTMEKMVKGYFGGSFSKMVSFFTDRSKVDTKELDEIMKIIQEKKKQ